MEFFNSQIQNFDNADHEKSDKPQQVSKPGSWSEFKIKQNAVEMHNLLILFPVLFGSRVPEDIPHWKVILSFLHVVELLCCPSFKIGEVMYLRDCIEEFLELYKKVFPETKLKPKAHFLTHYPSQILELGPPVNHNTVRFEAKRNFFKEIYHRTKNTINITKTLAKRHQFSMYLTYKNDLILEHPSPQAINASELPIVLLETNLRAKYEALFGTGISVITLASGVIFEGLRYAKNSVVVTGFQEDNLQFGKIENVIFRIKTPYLVYRKLRTLGFNVHFNAYEVMETEELDLVTVDNLYDYQPLGMYSVSAVDCYLVLLRHHIFT